jgi:WD40 repeat protein
LGLTFIFFLTCGGIAAVLVLSRRGGGTPRSFEDQIVGKWVMEQQATKLLRPDFNNAMPFFLNFAKDHTATYGEVGQDRSVKWEIKGQVAEGTEIWLRNQQSNLLAYILKIKLIDDDHIEVTQSAYVGNCRMKREGAGSLAPSGERGPEVDVAKSSPRKGPKPGEPLELAAHKGRIVGIKQTLDGALVTGDADGVLKVWDPGSWNVKRQQSIAKGHVLTSFDIVANGETAIIGTVLDGTGGSGTIYHWRWTKDEKPAYLSAVKKAPRAIAVGNDGRFAVWEDDDWLVTWDLNANKEANQLTGVFPDLFSLHMLQDASCVVTVAPKGVQVWANYPKPKPPFTTQTIPNATCSLIINQTLLVGTSDGKAIVWDIVKKQAIQEFPLPGPAHHAALSLNGRRAVIRATSAVAVFDTSGAIALLGTQPMQSGQKAVLVALDREGNRLATAGDDAGGKVSVWDISQVK